MFKQRLHVFGIKFFKGNVEGTDYDHTKIVVMMPVPADSKTQKGFNTVELVIGDSTKADIFKDSTFPTYVEGQVVLTTRGYEATDVSLVATESKPSAVKAA